MKLHPGVHVALAKSRMNEAQLARTISLGELTSPQQYGNSWFFALRLTGTGASYRESHDEYVWRDPLIYMNQGFMDRCSGLPVIIEHPERRLLNTTEFRKRVIGSIVYPYLKEEEQEVWGIARIIDQPVAKFMRENKLSTSPAVVFLPSDGNEKIDVGSGKHFLIEGTPSLIDHLAICEAGVWDKSGPPTGVDVSTQESKMDDKDTMEDRARKDEDETKKKEADARKDAEEKAREEQAAADARADDKIDKLLSGITTISSRMDSIEERMGDKRRADEDKEKEDKEEADARKDEEEDKEKKEADARKDKSRKDDDPDKDREQAAELRQLAAEEAAEAEGADRKDSMDWDKIKRGEGESDAAYAKRADEMAVKCDSRFAKRVDESLAAYCDRVASGARADSARRDNARRLSSIDVVADAVGKLALRVDSIYDRIQDRTEDDEVRFADIQSRADQVYEAHGDHAPRPMRGENTVGYRIRLARGLQKHSKSWGESDLSQIARADARSFENIEGAIYADAMVAARTPTPSGNGTLREVKVKGPYGNEMIEFVGASPLSWMSSFMHPGRSARLTKIAGQHAPRPN